MGYDRGDSVSFDFLNQMEFHLVQNRKQNCHHDHIPFNVKGNRNIVFSVWKRRPGGIYVLGVIYVRQNQAGRTGPKETQRILFWRNITWTNFNS